MEYLAKSVADDIRSKKWVGAVGYMGILLRSYQIPRDFSIHKERDDAIKSIYTVLDTIKMAIAPYIEYIRKNTHDPEIAATIGGDPVIERLLMSKTPTIDDEANKEGTNPIPDERGVLEDPDTVKARAKYRVALLYLEFILVIIVRFLLPDRIEFPDTMGGGRRRRKQKRGNTAKRRRVVRRRQSTRRRV
jgi:hypothetical protein